MGHTRRIRGGGVACQRAGDVRPLAVGAGTMRIWEIKSRDGKVLHSGKAKTRRALIASLVAGGKSLARADLRKADLNGLDLQEADLQGALLDEANLSGAQLQGANLSGASLRAARGQGARFDQANLGGADLTAADLTGARLTYASLRAAIIDRAVFRGASAASVSLAFARGEGADFSGAGLVNADFAHATLIKCDFCGAKLGHRAFGNRPEEELERLCAHLPDRTRGATVVGCDYDEETSLATTVPAMRSDRRVNRLTRFGLWASSTLAFVGGIEHGFDLLQGAQLASAHLGTGIAFVGVMSGMALLKTGIGDWVGEKAREGMGYLTRKVRETMAEMHRVGARRWHLVCAIGRAGSLQSLRLALAARAPDADRMGVFSAFRSFVGDLGDVILCDRRHLAMALATLSADRHLRVGLPRDVVLVRCDRDQGCKVGPCAVSFLKDGTSTAIWPLPGGRHARAVYGSEGELVRCLDDSGAAVDLRTLGLPDAAATRLGSALEFEAALLADHDLGGFSYPREDHMIAEGRDGSFIVQRVADRRIGNTASGNHPAVVRPDGTGLLMRNGSVGEDWKPAAP